MHFRTSSRGFRPLCRGNQCEIAGPEGGSGDGEGETGSGGRGYRWVGQRRSVALVEPDVLGPPYERQTIELGTDDEGPVVATLVRRRAERPTGRAVLYVHGFVDYFFQTHLADFFAERGWDFYALDLRKYGRSLLPHQTPNFCQDISDYFPELDAAAEIIRADHGHDTLLAMGHSTGGLIISLWADARRDAGTVDGLVLNSPFFDLNAPWAVRRPSRPPPHGWAAGRRTASCRSGWARCTARACTPTTAASGATTWPGSRWPGSRSEPAG
ncbi:hypothetical protein GCM10027614_33380 [Micromonospora vulcania]